MPVNRERNMVEVTTHRSIDLEYCTLESIKADIDSLINEYGTTATVKKHEYPYEEGYSYQVYIKRPETDEEMNRRIAHEEKWEAERLEYKRKEYEALKREFEGK